MTIDSCVSSRSREGWILDEDPKLRDSSTGAFLLPSVERPYEERAEGTHEQVEPRATLVTTGI